MSSRDTSEAAGNAAENSCDKCGRTMPDVCDACCQKEEESDEYDSDDSVIQVDLRKCDGYEFELQRNGIRRAVCQACNQMPMQCPNCEVYYEDEDEDQPNTKGKRRKRKHSTESEESEESEASEESDESEQSDDEDDGSDDAAIAKPGRR